MDTLIFNRIDHIVTGHNRPALLGEYAVRLPYPITLFKTVTDIQGKKQKTNAEGQLLYKDNVATDELGVETFDEVTEARKPIAWESVGRLNKWVDQEGIPREEFVTVQEPTDWADLEPVEVDNIVSSGVAFQDAPNAFTYEELIEAKKASIQAANPARVLAFYDEDYPLENFSDELASHAANMGDGIMALHPNGGSCRTVKLPLGEMATVIQLYLEAQPDVKVEVGATSSSFVEVNDGLATLPAAADEIYVKFTNLADRYRDVYAFGILA